LSVWIRGDVEFVGSTGLLQYAALFDGGHPLIAGFVAAFTPNIWSNDLPKPHEDTTLTTASKRVKRRRPGDAHAPVFHHQYDDMLDGWACGGAVHEVATQEEGGQGEGAHPVGSFGGCFHPPRCSSECTRGVCFQDNHPRSQCRIMPTRSRSSQRIQFSEQSLSIMKDKPCDMHVQHHVESQP
jgi:hypothetical protein